MIASKTVQITLSATIAILSFAGGSKLLGQQEQQSPSKKLVSEFLAAINSKDETTLKSFCETKFEDKQRSTVLRRIAQMKQLSGDVGKIELVQIASFKANNYTARCKTAVGPSLAFTIETTGDDDPVIASIDIMSFENPDDLEPLTKEERTEVIEQIASELDGKYVFPKLGKQMSDMLLSKLKEGAYDELDNATRFAEVLTEQLQEICSDKHLSIRAGVGRARTAQRRQPDNRRSNYGFVKTEVLPGNIGYIKFNMFDPTQAAQDVAASAMKFVENTDALIFDLRENGGGSPVMIAFLQTYLFDEKVHLNSFYNRPTDTTSESWTFDEIPGKKYGATKPVYVLTSSYTFSGAEEFSYNLKHLKRGTIVGEKTGGGAHPSMIIRLGKRMRMSLPFARAINPVTKTNWEGTGVIPHVPVPSDQALQKAIQLAEKANEQAKETEAKENEEK